MHQHDTYLFFVSVQIWMLGGNVACTILIRQWCAGGDTASQQYCCGCECGDLQKKHLVVCPCVFKCQSQHFFQTDNDFYLLTCADCFPCKGNKTQCHNNNKQLFKQGSVYFLFKLTFKGFHYKVRHKTRLVGYSFYL